MSFTSIITISQTGRRNGVFDIKEILLYRFNLFTIYNVHMALKKEFY